jgi:hypothetical protein
MEANSNGRRIKIFHTRKHQQLAAAISSDLQHKTPSEKKSTTVRPALAASTPLKSSSQKKRSIGGARRMKPMTKNPAKSVQNPSRPQEYTLQTTKIH